MDWGWPRAHIETQSSSPQRYTAEPGHRTYPKKRLNRKSKYGLKRNPDSRKTRCQEIPQATKQHGCTDKVSSWPYPPRPEPRPYAPVGNLAK